MACRDKELENDEVTAKEAVVLHQIKQLEKTISVLEDEIQHLQNLLGERVVSKISDPTNRLIYLEEHSRSLEQVKVPNIQTQFTKKRCFRNNHRQLIPLLQRNQT